MRKVRMVSTKSVPALILCLGIACGIAGMVGGWVFGGPLVSAAVGAGAFVVGIALAGIIARAAGWKPESGDEGSGDRPDSEP